MSLGNTQGSLHTGCLKVTHTRETCSVHSMVRETSYVTTPTRTQEQTQKQTGKVSIRQDLPTVCRHPLVPRDSSSHPTHREEKVKGAEGEKEKTGVMTDVTHAAHNHTDNMKRQ